MFGVISGQFIGQNLHFAINLFLALACFTAGWLYLDAWSERHKFGETAKWVGFFVLAVGLLLSGAAWGEPSFLSNFGNVFKLIGYIGIIIGTALDPIQPKPKAEDYMDEDERAAARAAKSKPANPKPSTPTAAEATPPQTAVPAPAAAAPPTTTTTPAPTTTALSSAPALPSSPPPVTSALPTPTASTATAVSIPVRPVNSAPTPTPNTTPPPTPAAAATPTSSSSAVKTLPAFGLWSTVSSSLTIAMPIGALIIAALYWRRATTGLERHIKPLAYTFTTLALSEAFGLASLWTSTDNPLLQNLVKPLGPLWILQHVTLLASGILLIWWVWRYLTKRLLTQIFLMTTSLTVSIVLVATISITALLLSSLQKASLSNLETAAKVLSYAIASKTAETRADAEVLAQNPATATAVGTRDHTALTKLANDLLVQKQLSDVLVISDTGQVLLRASEPERYGDSLSDDSLVRRALTGTTASSISSVSGVLAPRLIISTASPIRSGSRIVGATLSSLALDNAFVDGIKHTTGLDSTVYSGPTRAATTLVGPDGSSRQVGVKEAHGDVLNQTLKQGKIWHGSLEVSNQSFLAIYLPLKDVDNTVVGMLFVGQQQDVILQAAQDSVNLTFVSAVAWLLIIMAPIYLMSRGITRQLH